MCPTQESQGTNSLIASDAYDSARQNWRKKLAERVEDANSESKLSRSEDGVSNKIKNDSSIDGCKDRFSYVNNEDSEDGTSLQRLQFRNPRESQRVGTAYISNEVTKLRGQHRGTIRLEVLASFYEGVTRKFTENYEDKK